MPRFAGRIAFTAALLAAPGAAIASGEPDAARAFPPRIYTTSRLQAPPPAIDGRLDDAAWLQGEWAGNYTQQLPTEGAAPSRATELKILYDEKNIYVAIRAHDDLDKVSRYPSRRDGLTGDIVGICFDSYFDKRTGFEFDLNAAGTKVDLILTNEGWDTSWDAVWFGKVGTESGAWTAEFQIPLSQLRYGSQDVQVWGMHSWRWIDRLQEEDQWNLIPRNGTGRMYNFGELHGIERLQRFRRVELLPHVVGQIDSRPGETGNPYVGDLGGGGSVGLDAKVGITTDFTLDVTVNPDFGQVEADPSVVNLTTYETFFEEKRPFFLEGKRILSFGLDADVAAGDVSGTTEGDQLFYSRRIGQPPSYDPSLLGNEFLDLPDSTTILSAAKVTGKTRDGLSFGLLQSVTGKESAGIWFDGVERRVPVEPTTNYLVGRLQKDWNKGNTILGGMVTSTHRWLPDRALRHLSGDALTGAVDLARFFSNRSYVVEAKGVFSRIIGDREAIRALQTDPVHYYQRPDADHLGVDPDATSLSGHGGTLRVARYGNSKWRWSESARWMSPGLELNDVGFLKQADVILNEAELGFQETDPRGPFRQYSVKVSRDDAWDFGGLQTEGSTGLEATAKFQNKWELSTSVHGVEAPVDTRLLRGGPAMTKSAFLSAFLSGQTDPSRRVVVSASAHRNFVADGGSRAGMLSSTVKVRPTNSVSLSAEVDYERNLDDLQYVDTALPGGVPKYVLGRLDQTTLGVTLRADVHLTPDLSIQYYGSPFVSNGHFAQFKRATTPRADRYDDRFHLFTAGEITFLPDENAYRVDENGVVYGFTNPDFSFRQFRSNLVTRWEFTPGSSLYVVWSQGRTDEFAGWDRSLAHSFNSLRQTPASNVFLVKLSYWFSL